MPAEHRGLDLLPVIAVLAATVAAGIAISKAGARCRGTRVPVLHALGIADGLGPLK
jgi:hypothetical protein